MKLSDFNNFRLNSMVKFKEEIVQDSKITIVSYMIANPDFWKQTNALETRGITFDSETGKCICRPFEKFFNIGEKEDTQEFIVKDSIVECFSKRDGSMLNSVLINDPLIPGGTVLFKTKKSFFSDVAIQANKDIPRNIFYLNLHCLQRGLSPIWEFTHPDHRIVISYPSNENYTLLAIREMDSGKYISYDSMEEIVKIFSKGSKPINVIQKFEMTWKQIKYSLENDTGIEGYVLVLKDGRRVKVKTKWYLQFHRIMTQIHERDIAEAVVNGTIDDIKSLVSKNEKPLKPIEEIENKVINELLIIQSKVEEFVNFAKSKEMSIKETAIYFNGNPYFGLIMNSFRGKEPNYNEYWMKNCLKSYSLKVIFNPSFSGSADIDN